MENFRCSKILHTIVWFFDKVHSEFLKPLACLVHIRHTYSNVP